MELMEIYWILKLDDISFLLGASCLIFIGLGLFFMAIGCDIDSNHMAIGGAIVVVVGLLLGVSNTFVPTTKQYLTMIGGSFLTTNDKVITTTEKGFELLDQYLDVKLKGATNETKPKTTD